MQAWLSHLVGVFLGTLAILFVNGLLDIGGTTAFSSGMDVLGAAVRKTVEILGEFGGVFLQKPIAVALAVAGVFVLIELVFAGIAVLFAVWGAMDEPLRRTLRNSLSQTWLRTATILPAIIAIGVVGFALERSEARWSHEHPPPANWPTFPPFPQLPPTDPGYAKAMADYGTAMAEYQAENRRIRPVMNSYRRTRPWFLRIDGPLVALTGFGGAVCFVAGLLRGVGARRRPSKVERPPMCESCGYNLTGLPWEARCPECGSTVASSLDPGVRPGAPWEFRASLGRPAAWGRTFMQGVRDSTGFGRLLRVSAGSRDHRRYFGMHLPFIFALGGLGLLFIVSVAGGMHEVQDDPIVPIIVASIFGLACVLGTIAVTLVTATVVGLWHGNRHRRNLLPASVQAATYLVGSLVCWEVFGAATACGTILLVNDPWLMALQEISGIHREVLGIWSWLIPNAVCAILYVRFVSRITAATAHANT